LVKQEIIFWRYLFKTRYGLLLFPLILTLLAVWLKSFNADLSNQLLIYIVFPVMLFPVVASLYQMGSINHKELLLTYPLNAFFVGWIRPVLLSLVYSAVYTAALRDMGNYSAEELGLAFTSAVFYMILSSFFLIFFKNIALGIVLPLAYLFFGMFTTGTGQGFLYLMQWNRANPNLSLQSCMVTQAAVALIFSLGALYFLKRRNVYHWTSL